MQCTCLLTYHSQAENLVLTLRDLFQVIFEERKKESQKKESGAIAVDTSSGSDTQRATTLDLKKVATD